MASTERGRRLTEEHRQDQVDLGLSLRKWIMALFRRRIEYERIDESAVAFAREAAPKVLQFRNASRMLSLDYLDAFQLVETGDRRPVGQTDDDLSAVDVVRELANAARGAMKATVKKGYAPGDTVDAGESAVAGRAARIAGDGGRRQIEGYVERGRGPVGYARVVDADPCAFCAMLASRGVSYTGLLDDGAGLYRTDSFVASNARFSGGGRFKVHDNCDCTLEPVYKVDGKVRLPGNGDELAREWARIASGADDPINTWRRWRERGVLPEDYDTPLDRRVRKAPVHGQRRGRKKVKPAKKNEPKAVSDLTRDDYVKFADDYRRRIAGIDSELEVLRSVGQTERDINVLQLLSERKRREEWLAKFLDKAASM